MCTLCDLPATSMLGELYDLVRSVAPLLELHESFDGTGQRLATRVSFCDTPPEPFVLLTENQAALIREIQNE